MAEPWMLSLAEMAARIRRKKLSPVELVESLLKRIDSLEPSLKAWVTIDRGSVLNEARRKENEKPSGPLHGVPIGIKDIFYTAGMKTTGGSPIFADFVPDHDATSVRRLKEAGAIILGKTATTEFAFLDPAPTRNPWNPGHTPGGSSSGSAAAVASGMCPAALGSQTGGSVLRPAAYCGVVGLKPTYGRISRFGVFPLSWSLDHVGAFARTVEDAAIMLGVLAGKDPQDPSASPKPVPDYARTLKGSRRPKLGFIREFFEENAEEALWDGCMGALSRLEKDGARVEDVRMPASFSAVQDAHRVIMRVEAASFHESLFEEHREVYRPNIRELVEIGHLIPAVDYLRAQKIRSQFRREMEEVLERYDALLTPTTPTAAPKGLSSTGNAMFQNPWSFSGLPTITLPFALNEERLPLGIQLVGRPFAEAPLFSTARWCEGVLEFSGFPSGE